MMIISAVSHFTQKTVNQPAATQVSSPRIWGHDPQT